MDDRRPLSQPLLKLPFVVTAEQLGDFTEEHKETGVAPNYRRKPADIIRFVAVLFTSIYRSILISCESCSKITRSWTAEACSYFFSVVTFAGLVVILLGYQDKPNPEWPQLVSINSVVSLFSLVMRASVSLVLAEGISQSKWQWYRSPRSLNDMARYDSASRGPWGSVLMLCSLRPKKIHFVAALGALATIMVSLTGFFAQQLLQFETCQQRNSSTVVTVAKTNIFNASGMAPGPGQWDEYGPLTVALNVGLIQPVQDQTSVLTEGCISGNCSFPSIAGESFSTLSLMHECVDVSSYIVQRNITMNQNMTGTVLTVQDQDDPYTSLWVRPQNGYGEVLATRSHTPEVSDQIKSGNIQLTMLFRQDPAAVNFSAVQCTLHPTVNTYGVNITNGRIHENLINSTRIPTRHIRELEGYDETLDSDFRMYHHSWMTTTHMLNNGTRELCTGSEYPRPGMARFYKITGQEVVDNPDNTTTTYDLGKVWYYPRGCIWDFYSSSIQGIQTSFFRMFYEQKLNLWRGNALGSIQLRALYRLRGQDGGRSAAEMAGDISFETINDTMGEVARALTNVIRTHGIEGPSWYAQGDMWYTTTCVRVEWKWIAFPVVMISLTGIFLLLVLVENHGVESDRLWKSSILAALFCEVDTQQDKPIGKEEMMRVARSTGVSLEEKSGGTLRLVAR